ncbi:tRNA(fMet)-specific endonuclease VapC [archaeon HR01]|nr:tRNA(fMet)-specific endonuclease VapC [archaeon HR01]
MGKGSERMEKPKIIDTSALYPLVKKMGRQITDIAKELTILDLTWYELGNVLVKAAIREEIKKLGEVAQVWREILSAMKTEKVREIEEVAQLAKKDRLTYYDAAYIYKASKMNLKLITEDQELKNRYPELCISINEL